MSDAETIDRLLTAALCDREAEWPAFRSDNALPRQAMRRMHFHGACVLLSDRTEHLIGWPEAVLAEIKREAFARTMWELQHKALLTEAIETLAARGIRSVCLKGTALAYSAYEKPAQRMRGDTDLLVYESDLPLARATLRTLVWQMPLATNGAFGDLHYQDLWRLKDRSGFKHDIDLHWEITNSKALGQCLNADHLIENSIPLTALSPSARAPDKVTAVLHRALNRAEHARSGYFTVDRNEHDPRRLIWAMDIDLITETYSSDDWEALADRAVHSGVASICLEALDHAHSALGTHIPDDIRNRLARAPRNTPETRFIAKSSNVQRGIANLKATQGFRNKLYFTLAHLLPSSQHMRRKFPEMKRWPLVTLYIRRIVEGLPRHLVRQQRT